jgi:hypothetical protein
MNTTHIQTIHTHCSHPGCDARLHCFEEWAIGLCTFHADPEHAPLPAAPEPDWNAILEAIDANQPRPFAPYRPMKRES